MTQTAVRVRGLTKRYGEVRAVDGIDLDIAAGEVFAILGPNGAGKSTTVEILEGYRKRDAGEVTVLGADPGHPTRQWRSRVGIVLQTSNDTAELTVRETVRHFAGYYPGARDPDEVIARVGLAEQAGKRIRQLSGGQRRRVDVALGVVGRPELLFLDEPTTGFDPEARRTFWELIEDLARDGTTIVLTTHYLDEAEALADRVAVIARGRIVAQDRPSTLGGRAAARATVGWLEDGERRHLETGTPTATILELTGRFGGEVPELTVTRPSLEDVYMNLIAETTR
ncbi:ABC transporter ATP-binding protein [Sphaerisporangium sp. NPDC005289]|uniref:ABC transporter ATP-binding protein n=1 Tax=Sphaerisporangium sp. NPDC005289 TaxID=3155247 RepID=UPI0033AC817D